jgi:hypothetical protein
VYHQTVSLQFFGVALVTAGAGVPATAQFEEELKTPANASAAFLTLPKPTAVRILSILCLQELEHPPTQGLSEEEVEMREEQREKLHIVKTVLEQVRFRCRLYNPTLYVTQLPEVAST